MTDEHRRYERLAVGHVVGGLDEVDAAAFRAHLVACRDCRSRVGELRDIASSLVATARAERSAARTAGIASPSPDGRGADDEAAPQREVPQASWRSWVWGSVAVALATVVLLGGLAWAVWLRAENDVLAAVTDTQDQVLGLLVAGREVGWTGSAAVAGAVVTDGTRAAINLGGVPALQVDEGFRVWLLDADGAVVAASEALTASRTRDGRLTVLLDQPADAATLVVTVEEDPAAVTAPTGHELLRADLTAPTAQG